MIPGGGADDGGDFMRPAETPRYPGEPRGTAHDPFRAHLAADASDRYGQADAGAT